MKISSKGTFSKAITLNFHFKKKKKKTTKVADEKGRRAAVSLIACVHNRCRQSASIWKLTA